MARRHRRGRRRRRPAGPLTAAVAGPSSTWEAILGRGGRSGGDRNGPGDHGLLPQGRRRQDHDGGQPRPRARRGPVRQVCVVDLDLAFGDVAITLQLVPDHTIAEAAESEEHLDFALLQTLLTRLRRVADDPGRADPPGGPGPDRPPSGPPGDRTLRAALRLRRHRHPARASTTRCCGAFDETDECIVVATLDVPTIKNTKVALETLDLLHLVRQQPAPGAQPGRRGGRALAARTSRASST